MDIAKGLILFALGGLFTYSLLRYRQHRQAKQLDKMLEDMKARREADGNTRTDNPFTTWRAERDARFQRESEAAAYRLSA